MTDLSNVTVTIGCFEDGRWLAATSESPYFCLEATTEDEVTTLAGAAIRFYESVLVEFGGKLPEAPKRSEPHLYVKRRVSARELASVA